MLAEHAVRADRAVAFVRQLAVVTYGKLNAVPMRATDIGSKDAISLLEARYGALVEVRLAASERFRVRERLDFFEGKDIVKRRSVGHRAPLSTCATDHSSLTAKASLL
ncbi:hypothetical protein [Paraburkholderia strydomiana]|uniref:hypothetical protein n=1 Tax=Paraburkholderia strydomiana TaxID=1245417 RepID=UPI0038B77D2D